MSHPFGDLIAHHLHRKHGLSQSKLAAGILQSPSVITDMCQGKRLQGRQARERVVAIIAWLLQQGALETVAETRALLAAAGMAPLRTNEPTETKLLQKLYPSFTTTPTRPTPDLQTGLPIPPTSFIGRMDELAAIEQRLVTPHCRLLTLVGPGGIGKTRLALQIANAHLTADPDGVIFVDLAPLSSAEYLVSAIAIALNFSFSQRDEPERQLLAHLREKKLLLVLDNFEHLLEGVSLVVTILQQAPHITILVTSRERLNVQGEWVFTVGGLEVPPFGEIQGVQFEHYSAIALFLQRTYQVQPDFAPGENEKKTIVRICQLVEGVPLAIELVAVWTRVLSCVEIIQEIERGLTILNTPLRDLPARHRSLQAVFDHSWQLLSQEEQQTFARLSVFRGSFTRQAALQVANAALPRLSALIDKSLLRRNQIGDYEIHELARQFAWTKLQQSDELALILERHESYCVALSTEELHGLRARIFYPSYYDDKATKAQSQFMSSQSEWLAKKKAMRVLMMSWELGGLGKHVTELASAFGQIKSDDEQLLVDVLTPHFSHREAVEPCNPTVSIHRLEMPLNTDDHHNRGADNFLTNSRLFVDYANGLLKQRQYDLIHTHDWVAGTAGVTLKQQWNLPLITTIHAINRRKHHQMPPRDIALIDQLERNICHMAEQIIVCSQFMRQEVQNFWNAPSDKINVIANGVKARIGENCSLEELAALRQQYAPTGQKLLFFVGPTIYEKGLLVLIRAMPHILIEHPNTQLLVASKYGDKLRPLAYELRVENAITFLGYISDHQRDCLYQVADVAIIPSLYEPFGIVALEAMALGCNIIASNVGGLSEVVKHTKNGLLIQPNDPQSLVCAVDQLFADPTTAQGWRLRALQEIDTLYNWDKIAAQTIQVYRSVVFPDK